MNRRKILVVGYYHRNNLGDDVFEHVLTNYFQSKWPTAIYSFVSVDDLFEIPLDTSAVIFGGGDLINDYFFDKVKEFLKNKTCPWYAISIGIPYPKLVERGYLDYFDYVIYRNASDDLQIKNSKWFPDISFLLKPNNTIKFTHNYNQRGTKKIGVFLSRTIYNRNDESTYYQIVNNLSIFLSNIVNRMSKSLFTSKINEKFKYELYLLPFCTDGTKLQDDRLINQDVFNRINHRGNVHLIDDEIQMSEIRPIFNSFYMTICTRFHAHMFSLMAEVPILSIYSTRKVEGLLNEIGADEYSYRMKTNDRGYPISIDNNILEDKFNKILTNYDSYKNKLAILNEKYSKEIKNFVNTLDNLLFYLPQMFDLEKVTERIGNKIIKMTESESNTFCYEDNHLIYNISSVDLNILINTDGAIKKYFDSEINTMKEYIVDLISYELTGNRKSIYHYGLSQQVFTDDYNLRESCKWILKHYVPDSYLDNTSEIKNRKINIANNDSFSGYHRSGWNFVVNNLKELHNPEGVIFDSYLDKTFGWEYDFLSATGVLPYNKPWIGVFHHTSNETYSENNLTEVFKKENFINSLVNCKGLIVFSNNNKIFLESKLNVPILLLTHPTETVCDNLKFNYKSFKLNPAKKVIQIGAWLRDSYAIYDLTVPDDFSKFALKGKDMGNYFVSNDNIDCITNAIKTVGFSKEEKASHHVIKNTQINKYIVGLNNLIIDNHQSVTVLQSINNDQYDDLLKNNIIFIKLVDASAVNTILECIVRNTPILVNRLPATEEYLGKDYPLFFDTISDVTDLLTNKSIKKAYKYLKKMDKTKFTIEFFLNSLINSKLYQKL